MFYCDHKNVYKTIHKPPSSSQTPCETCLNALFVRSLNHADLNKFLVKSIK